MRKHVQQAGGLACSLWLQTACSSSSSCQRCLHSYFRAAGCCCRFGASSDHWRRNLPELGRSCRAYAIDLIGYGYSDKPDPRELGPPSSFYNFHTWSSQVRSGAALLGACRPGS